MSISRGPQPPPRSTSGYIPRYYLLYLTNLLTIDLPSVVVQQSHWFPPIKNLPSYLTEKKNITNLSSPSMYSSPGGGGVRGVHFRSFPGNKRKSRIPCFANLRTVKKKEKTEKARREKEKKDMECNVGMTMLLHMHACIPTAEVPL